MWFILGTCVEVIGWSAIMDAYGIPIICANDPNCGSTSMFGDAHALAVDPTRCWLQVHPEDSFYDFLWQQQVTVNGVVTTTPGMNEFTAKPDAPYVYRAQWAEDACPPYFVSQGWCTVENVCTPADVTAGAGCTPPVP